MGNYIGPPNPDADPDGPVLCNSKKKDAAVKQTNMQALCRVIFTPAFMHSVVGNRNKTWQIGDSIMVRQLCGVVI